MKKLIAGVILLGILSSCGNKKTNIDPFASITKEVDSVRQIADSSHHDKSPEDPQPIQADESFDDFIYNFASDDVLQRQRVKFPMEIRSQTSRNATGSMTTCLPSSIIIHCCLIEKKTWI